MMRVTALDRVLADVRAERERQDVKWGTIEETDAFGRREPALWLAILTEEVGEVAEEIAEGLARPFDVQAYRTELIQTAAVAVSAVQALDRMNPRQALDRLGDSPAVDA